VKQFEWDSDFAQVQLWNTGTGTRMVHTLTSDTGAIGIILAVNKTKTWNHRTFIGPEITVFGFAPHWCLLRAFWSNSGLHSPKKAHFQDDVLPLHTGRATFTLNMTTQATSRCTCLSCGLSHKEMTLVSISHTGTIHLQCSNSCTIWRLPTWRKRSSGPHVGSSLAVTSIKHKQDMLCPYLM
jgi:hypothetical protein